jgi:hypothetical protein
MMQDEVKAPYPDTGILAVLARLAFLAAVIAIVIAVLAPMQIVPRILYSHYLEHFSAFYIATLLGLAAMPRTRIFKIAMGFFLFALFLECGHLLWDPSVENARRNWIANTGGVFAALAPVVVDRFRQRFKRR